jgi:hypothetical protein
MVFQTLLRRTPTQYLRISILIFYNLPGQVFTHGKLLSDKEYDKDGNLTFLNGRPVSKKNLVKKSFCVYNILKKVMKRSKGA